MVLMIIDHREAALPTLERGPAHAATDAGDTLRQSSLCKDALYRFARNGAAVAAALVFAVIVLYCALHPFSSFDPDNVDFGDAYSPPSLDHPFATDKFGRDLFTRVAVGGRISIGIGFAGGTHRGELVDEARIVPGQITALK
ncbi:MAG TPA: hypothetical protein VE693_09725 [Gaiellaceae bacterium]|jgi:ABC-type dipeptide/oligopeptide/nickel transport system permease subunit|nr:hypothetical protein [Gaiellaceae bacterium]